MIKYEQVSIQTDVWTELIKEYHKKKYVDKNGSKFKISKRDFLSLIVKEYLRNKE